MAGKGTIGRHRVTKMDYRFFTLTISVTLQEPNLLSLTDKLPYSFRRYYAIWVTNTLSNTSNKQCIKDGYGEMWAVCCVSLDPENEEQRQIYPVLQAV